MAAIELYDYQKRWVQDKSRFKIGMQARQTGKTFATTLEIVDDCFAAEEQGKRTRWVILSRGERQAREAIKEGVELHCKAYGLAIQTIESEFEVKDKDENTTVYKQLEVKLPGGSRIIALPANPDTARGYSANVFLDEFARHKDSKEIWIGLFPCISDGYKIRVTSTPNGKGNKFYEIFTAQDNLWSRHRTDIHQAIADGLPRDAEEMKTALKDDDGWDQEFLLKWLDEASAWLSYQLIYGVEHDQAGLPELYTGQPVYVGNDIGLRSDLWVVWIVEPIGDVLWTREIITEKRISFGEQDAILDEVFQRYTVARLCMDQTGMGEKPVEDAIKRYGQHRVEGVIFNVPSKTVLARIGKEAFEERTIRIPEGDEKLRTDLYKLKKEASLTGAPRFVAKSDSNGHADRTWACFLALHAAQSPPCTIDYHSAGVRETAQMMEQFAGDSGLEGF